LNRLYWLGLLGLVSAPFAACGPDAKPGPPCEGPTYIVHVRAENCRPLPPDTRLNVRYGGNHEGEPYALGETPSPQTVFCDEDAMPREDCGGNAAASPQGGAAGAAADPPASSGVWQLSCRLYTQGPARIDVTATGYEPIEEQDLTLDEKKRCQVERVVELKVLMDAGI
jgi:hypothetical protein